MIRCALPETKTRPAVTCPRDSSSSSSPISTSGSTTQPAPIALALPVMIPDGIGPDLVRLAVDDDRVARVRARPDSGRRGRTPGRAGRRSCPSPRRPTARRRSRSLARGTVLHRRRSAAAARGAVQILRERTISYNRVRVRASNSPRGRPACLAARDRRRGGRDHVDPRHDDRQRGARDPQRRSLEPDRIRAVGRDRVHARPRRGDTSLRLGGAAAWHEAPLRDLARPVHARLAPLWVRVVDRLADRLPGTPRTRRRDADAHGDDHPRPRCRPRADGACPQRRRRADGPRAGVRARHRRAASSSISGGVGSSSSTSRSGSSRSCSR